MSVEQFAADPRHCGHCSQPGKLTYNTTMRGYLVMCTGCGMRTPYIGPREGGPTKEDAQRQALVIWNTRATDPGANQWHLESLFDAFKYGIGRALRGQNPQHRYKTPSDREFAFRQGFDFGASLRSEAQSKEREIRRMQHAVDQDLAVWRYLVNRIWMLKRHRSPMQDYDRPRDRLLADMDMVEQDYHEFRTALRDLNQRNTDLENELAHARQLVASLSEENERFRDQLESTQQG